MKLSDLKRAYPPLSGQGHAQFVNALNQLQEDAPMKKKITLSLAFALVLVLALAATAAAVVARFSIKEQIDPKFADKVTEIGQEYENQWMDVSINDAISDSMRMSFAMNMRHKEGAEEVYVFPVITAESEGKALDVDLESGYELFDGAWLPEKTENPAGEGNYAADFFIMEDNLPGPKGDIVWTLTFHVLKPNWPLEQDEYTAKGHYEGDRIEHEKYEQMFRDAYRNKKILLTYGDTTVEYCAYLPIPQGVGEEEFMMMRQWEKLVRSGAFDEVDSFSCTFRTPESERREALPEEISAARTFADYDLTVHRTSVSSMQLLVEFSMAPKRADYPGKDVKLHFDALAEGKKLPFMSQTFSRYDDGMLGFAANFDLTRLDQIPGEITFVPVLVTYTPQGVGKNPLVEEKRVEADAFTVKVGEGDGKGHVSFGD